MELDYYAGWASAIGDTDFGIDVGYIYYAYPGDDGPDGDYQEFYVKGSWRDLTLGVAYSDDYYAETDEFWYFAAITASACCEDCSLGLHVGYNILDDEGGFLADSSGRRRCYTDYSVSRNLQLGASISPWPMSVPTWMTMMFSAPTGRRHRSLHHQQEPVTDG